MARKRYGKVDPQIILDESLPDGAKIIYTVLTLYCDRNRECYPSVDTLKRNTGMTNKTFYKYMNILEQRGIIQKRYEKTGPGNLDKKLIYKLCDFGD